MPENAETDDAEKDPEELLQQSMNQTRHSADPADADDQDADAQSLADAVADAYRDLDAGERHENLTVRDENLAALVAGLEETDRLADVAQRANDHLGRDADAETRADALKALLRVGLAEVASEEVEDGKEGRRIYVQQTEAESAF